MNVNASALSRTGLFIWLHHSTDASIYIYSIGHFNEVFVERVPGDPETWCLNWGFMNIYIIMIEQKEGTCTRMVFFIFCIGYHFFLNRRPDVDRFYHTYVTMLLESSALRSNFYSVICHVTRQLHRVVVTVVTLIFEKSKRLVGVVEIGW